MRKRIYIWISIAIALFLLFGCRNIKYVPVETVRTDSLYFSVHERDSIYVHDSVYVKDKGDTLFIDRWHTRYLERVLNDTVYIERVKVVEVPYPVEKKLTKWQKVKIELGGWAFGAIVLFAMIIVCRLLLKRINK